MTSSPTRPFTSIATGLGVVVLAACSTAYYSTWEMLGQEKRDLLRSNVESVQKEQVDAAEEFEDALDRLRGLYDVDADDLERTYDKLKDNVLYLKHNLNAAAIGGLSAEVDSIEADIEVLLADMRKSIAEADRFLANLSE
ncbi:MAG: DUF2959 family protein [Thermoanaerobaculales bacterium]|jgi:hypothetical protein|nr:DUF2959 family protein [Thermoanaerobaculales bacterium]